MATTVYAHIHYETVTMNGGDFCVVTCRATDTPPTHWVMGLWADKYPFSDNDAKTRIAVEATKVLGWTVDKNDVVLLP